MPNAIGLLNIGLRTPHGRKVYLSEGEQKLSRRLQKMPVIGQVAAKTTRFGHGARYIEPVVICWSCDMVSRPRDLADRMSGRRKLDDGYLRETFTLPRDKARTRARDFLARYPKAAYMSGVESWRELPGGDIEFTMRRLRSSD